MLGLTRKTDYALIALVHLARQGNKLSNTREISGRYGVPLPVLMNIMKSLNRAGLVESVRGVRGGYRLALRAERVTLKLLVNVIEGPVRLVPCIEIEGLGHRYCGLVASCPVRSPAVRVQHRFDRFLEEVTLAKLAEDTCGSAATNAPALVEICR